MKGQREPEGGLWDSQTGNPAPRWFQDSPDGYVLVLVFLSYWLTQPKVPRAKPGKKTILLFLVVTGHRRPAVCHRMLLGHVWKNPFNIQSAIFTASSQSSRVTQLDLAA